MTERNNESSNSMYHMENTNTRIAHINDIEDKDKRFRIEPDTSAYLGFDADNVESLFALGNKLEIKDSDFDQINEAEEVLEPSVIFPTLHSEAEVTEDEPRYITIEKVNAIANKVDLDPIIKDSIIIENNSNFTMNAFVWMASKLAELGKPVIWRLKGDRTEIQLRSIKKLGKIKNNQDKEELMKGKSDSTVRTKEADNLKEKTKLEDRVFNFKRYDGKNTVIKLTELIGQLKDEGYTGVAQDLLDRRNSLEDKDIYEAMSNLKIYVKVKRLIMAEHRE